MGTLLEIDILSVNVILDINCVSYMSFCLAPVSFEQYRNLIRHFAIKELLA